MQALDGEQLPTTDSRWRQQGRPDVGPTTARMRRGRYPPTWGDFVSQQAIQTYLIEHRGAEYNLEGTDPFKRESTNIQQLRRRIISVADGKFEQLQKNEDIQLGEFGILVDSQVVYENCNP